MTDYLTSFNSPNVLAIGAFTILTNTISATLGILVVLSIFSEHRERGLGISHSLNETVITIIITLFHISVLINFLYERINLIGKVTVWEGLSSARATVTLVVWSASALIAANFNWTLRTWARLSQFEKTTSPFPALLRFINQSNGDKWISLVLFLASSVGNIIVIVVFQDDPHALYFWKINSFYLTVGLSSILRIPFLVHMTIIYVRTLRASKGTSGTSSKRNSLSNSNSAAQSNSIGVSLKTITPLYFRVVFGISVTLAACIVVLYGAFQSLPEYEVTYTENSPGMKDLFRDNLYETWFTPMFGLLGLIASLPHKARVRHWLANCITTACSWRSKDLGEPANPAAVAVDQSIRSRQVESTFAPNTTMNPGLTFARHGI